MVVSQIAPGLFIGFGLLVISAALLSSSRRRADTLSLALFLFLVATNFLASSAADAGLGRSWRQLAYVALAMDPFFLLLYVTAFPYPRRPPLAKAVLILAALMGGLCALLATATPEAILPSIGGPLVWGNVLIVSNLGFAYFAAWLLSVAMARDAPTQSLARRASWLVLAVGVAILPRLGYLHADIGGPIRFALGAGVGFAILTGLALSAVIPIAAFAWGLRLAGPDGRRRLRPTLGLVAIIALALLALPFVNGYLATRFELNLGMVSYGVRWIVFGVVLLQAVLLYDLLELRSATERALPTVGALIGALVGGLTAASILATRGPSDSTIMIAGGAAAALALAPVGAWALRGIARRATAGTPAAADTRRLELYQAALESAWAPGPPDPEARAALERDRKAFGLTVAEARALEHAVSALLRRAPAALREGEEASPGIIVERELGRGAHGRVFAARRYPEGDRVVVKELLAADTPAGRQRLLAEVRALQAVQHPRIVRLLDVRIVEGRDLLVMEHVEGEPLDRRLARGRLGEAATNRLLGDLLDGLAAAHAQGIIHRDVKPSNVLVDAEGHARLTDFGVASAAGSEERVRATVTGLSGLGALVGTLAYMAPERARGEAATPSSDLYAAGLVAFECLTGRPALEVRAMGTLEALQVAAAPSIPFGEAPPEWREFLARALERAPERRFPSANTMRAALPGNARGPAARS